MLFRHRAVFLISVLGTVSCTSINTSGVGPSGLPPTVENLSFSDVAARQDALMVDLARIAGVPMKPGGPPLLPDLKPTDPNWFLLYKAGLGLIDGQCDEYLDALFKFNRERLAGQKGLTAVATTTGTVLGVTGVGGAAIAITSAAFGLASALFDASSQTVLFLIEPSAIRNVVVQAQGAHKTASLAAESSFTSRPDVVLGLQGYLSICTPAAIEASVNDAAAQRTFDTARDADGRVIPNVNPPLIPSSRDAAPISDRPVQPPAPLDEHARPRNLFPAETRLGLSLENARAIQRALCSAGAADGDFGPAGSLTRTAIADFQRARSLRSTREVTGALLDVDANDLLGAGPCPSVFRTAFERFYFGDSPRFDAPDTGRLANALAAIGAPEAGSLDDLRDAMARSGVTEVELADRLKP